MPRDSVGVYFFCKIVSYLTAPKLLNLSNAREARRGTTAEAAPAERWRESAPLQPSLDLNKAGLFVFLFSCIIFIFLFKKMCDSPARAVLDVYVVRPRSVYAVPLVPPDPWLPKPSAGADVTPVAVHWIKQLFF